MKVHELINELSKFPGDYDIVIDGYRAGLGDDVDKHNREYEPAGVEAFEKEGKPHLVLWGREVDWPNELATLADSLKNHDVRLETLIWVPGIYFADSAGETLEGFTDDLDEKSPIYAQLPELKSIFEDLRDGHLFEHEAADEVASTLRTHQRTGFLLEVATPVLTREGDTQTSSWGYYHTEWRYAETLDDVVAQMFAYETESNEADRAKGTENV